MFAINKYTCKKIVRVLAQSLSDVHKRIITEYSSWQVDNLTSNVQISTNSYLSLIKHIFCTATNSCVSELHD